MKNAKKVIAMLLALVMVLALCACGSKTEAPAAEAPAAEAPAAVETTVLKCAFNQTIDNPEAKTLQWIGEKLYEATDGRYTIEVYPDAQLGDQAQTLEQEKLGETRRISFISVILPRSVRRK